MDIVGGYRLVRKLGSGPRAEIYLGHAARGRDDAGLAVESRHVAAIKLYRSTAAQADIDVEIEALARVSSRHILELRDLATTPEGRPCLIFPRLSSFSLTRLLTMRGSLSPGEAVTALAPIALAIGELHRMGVVHGAIEPSSVLFSEDGAPVLARFGRAAIVGELPSQEDATSLTPAQLSDEPRVIADLDRLTALARTVLGSVPTLELTPSGRELTDWLDAMDTVEAAGGYPAELAERLFDLALGEPLSFEEGEAPSAPSPPGRMGGSVVPAGTPDWAPGPRSRSRDRAKAIVPADLDHRLAAHLDTHPIAELKTRIGAALGRIRRRFWAVGGLGATAVIVAIAIVPLDAAGTGHDHAVVGTTGEPSPRASRAAIRAGPVRTSTPAALRGDDPVAAAEALLAQRALCIRSLSTICLDGTDQRDGSALEEDRLLVRSLQEGKASAPPVGTVTATLSQRLGDSALLTLQASRKGTDRPSDPATPEDAAPKDAVPSKDAVPPKGPVPPKAVLIAKTQNGWLIRDLMVG